MKRRDFLKIVGLSTASLAVPASLLSAQQRQDKQSGQKILDQTDARIEKYRKGDAMLKLATADGKPLDAGLTVQIEQTRHKFLFGCGCEAVPEAELFNHATLAFYWVDDEPEQGRPDFKRAEDEIHWCKAHNVTTKGHPLAWNFYEPAWLPDDPEAVMETQLNRIRQCVRRFKGSIDIWIVVNEASRYDREICKKTAPKLTEAIRQMSVGEYVRQAFDAARQTNPEATLIINDNDTPVYEKVISQLVDKTGKPLYDVIGITSHMHDGYWGAKLTWRVCEQFAKFGKPLHFTETTLLSGEEGWDLREKRKDTNFIWASTPEGEKRQAWQVVEFYHVLFSHPAVKAITWWDLSDQDSWMEAPSGLLRTDMTPKPAYQQLMQLIKGKWWTQTETEVTTGGKARFRGFFGEYKASVRIGNREVTGSFSFDQSTEGTIDVQVRESL